jgi:hypothetical protein
LNKRAWKLPNRLYRCLAFVIIAIFAGPFSTGAAALEPTVAINWNLAPIDKVGSHKSGMACLPNGSLIWREISKPDSAIISETLIRLLVLDSVSGQNVFGDIVSIKASLCTPWLGVGESKPKSTLKIKVRWKVDRADGVPIDKLIETEVSRKSLDLRFDATLLLEALETSFRDAIEPAK